MAPSLRVVALLLFGSGFAALVYQTAWQRMFRLTFGASTAASAAVLAIFLGGLGLGGALLGKRVERSTRPLTYYGNLELGITGLAALSPFLGAGAHSLYLSLGGSQALGLPAATLLRLLIAALVIGPAAVLMGGTLPAAARAVVGERDASRGGLALLYSLNTVGAVVGALVGPLLLFGLLGNQLTLWGAACINALVALAARGLGRRAPEVPVEAAPTAEHEPKRESAPPGAPVPAAMIYGAAGLVGFVFLALELVWYRVLAPLLGGSSLTFGLILACALAGIGIGGYLFSRRPPGSGATLELLGLTLSLEAACVLLPFAWGDDFALLAAHLRATANLGYAHLLGVWVLIAAVLVLPASIVSGYQFPVIFSLLGRGRAQVALQVGRAYAFNTIGTLSGSLLIGFLLLPSLGALTLWRGLAQALAVFGVACAGLAWRRGASARAVAAPAIVAAVALALSLADGPGALFRHSPIGAGRLKIAGLTPNQIRELRQRTTSDILWERDGVESSVAISGANGLAFIVNGKIDGNIIGDRGTQTMLGMLPAALHGNVKSAFVVGLGTGMSCGLLGKVAGVERVDVAELEPAVLEMARRSSSVNGDVLRNSKVHLLQGDGRELLLTSKRSYDVIVSEPSNPYRAGIASLYTQEFYAAAASRMSKRSLFAQWLQGYEVDATTIATAIRTLRAVFPYVSMWGPQGDDLLLIASFEPPRLDIERLRAVTATPHYRNWMRRAWDMEGVEGLVAHHLAPPKLAEQLAASVPAQVNTDDVNVLEFAFARKTGQEYSIIEDFFQTVRGDETRPAVNGELDWKLVDELRHRAGFAAPSAPPPSAKTQAVLASCGGQPRRATELWPDPTEPSDLIEVWVAGWIRAAKGEDSALTLADQLEREGFVAEAFMVRMRLAQYQKNYAQQLSHLERVFDELRRTPLALCDTSQRALRMVPSLFSRLPERAPDLMRALAKGPFAIYTGEEARMSALTRMAGAMPTPQLCLEALGRFRANPAWRLDLLGTRADCLARAGAPDADAAVADLERFLAHDPQTFHWARAQQAPTSDAGEHAGEDRAKTEDEPPASPSNAAGR